MSYFYQSELQLKSEVQLNSAVSEGLSLGKTPQNGKLDDNFTFWKFSRFQWS